MARVGVVVLAVVGVVLIAAGVVLQYTFTTIFNGMLENKLKLTPGSKTLESFKSPPVPILMQFYLFNVTNRDAVLQGHIPILDQLGPYTFDEKPVKFNLSFDDDKGTVTYLQNKTFYYRPDLSPGVSLSDKVTTVNAVMMTLGSRLADQSGAFAAVVQLWFTRFGTSPLVTKSVRELLFDGYEEPLLLQLADLTGDPEHATGLFGFYRKNNTNGGSYTVYTGVKGMDNYQDIELWRGEPKLDFWKPDMWGGDACNMINGTAGTQFPRPVSRNIPLRLYVAELCRSIYAEYQKDVQHGALTLYRYVLTKELLANTPENKCFCYDNFTCRASMINVSPCRKGAPVVMSTPHFYQGDPQDAADILGLSPKASEHETYLDIEPNTGVVFRAAKRIQANIPMKQYGGLPAFQSVPEVILPVFWVNESAQVPIQRTKDLHRSLTLPFTLVRVGVGVLIALGLVLVLVAIIKVCLARKANQSKKNRGAHSRTPKNLKNDKTLTQKLNDRNYS